MDSIKYLVVAEIEHTGFILTMFSSKEVADCYHQKMYDLHEEYPLDQIKHKLKYIASYKINGNEIFLENTEIITTTGLYTVCVVKINMESFCLKSFIKDRKKRCIIPVNGFFEWMDINKIKYPHYITMKDDSIFSLAGIYDNWTDKSTGLKRSTFSILTTEANPLMAKIHNLKLRMPLILPREREMDWIKQEVSDEELNNLMLPFDEGKMKAHTIGRRITSRTENPNDIETIKPVEYPELALLD